MPKGFSMRRSLLLATAAISMISAPAFAQAPAEPGAGEIVVTAQRREEKLRDVPSSVAVISGDALAAVQAGGSDIRGLASRIPSLNVESSFGRTFPRFYIRGLGNTDFDLNASQPVSLVYDDVVLENPILKGFPIFDLQRVEVLRGPQGTLFGRNTPAGIVKFDSVKPGGAPGGYAKVSAGSYGSSSFEGAAGGDLSDTVSVRASALYQRRNDYVDNIGNGVGGNDLEGFEDVAARLQFQIKPSEALTVRFVGQLRTEDGTARLFRANVFAKGSNDLVGLGGKGTPFDRRKVRIDGINFQKLNTYNLGGTIDYDFGAATLTSVTSWWKGDLRSRGDIDGGFGESFPGGGFDPTAGPGIIPFKAQSQDDVPALDQFTQELRIASNGNNALTYQAGLFYFSEIVKITSLNFGDPKSVAANVTVNQRQKSDAYGAFASIGYALTGQLTVNGGIRYNKDKRDYSNARTNTIFPGTTGFVATGTGKSSVDEDNVTWDASIRFKPSDMLTLYARAARGYRAPSIQGRALFPGDTQTVQDTISKAKSETIQSYEAGLKSRFLDGAAGFNLTGYYYRLKNAQQTAVGGGSNAARVLNLAAVDGYGVEAEFDVRPADGLQLTAGVSYNNTKINDANAEVEGCGSGCTLLDPIKRQVPNGFGGFRNFVNINGNALPQAPKWTANVTARYGVPVGDGELYAFTDWAYRSKINFFLYDSVEYNSDKLLEGGLRIGYMFGDKRYDVAAFARNITNAVEAQGGIDFNNLTGFVNEPRIFGIEVGAKF
jgi:iron complex outermembrane recepter protein